MRNSAIHNLRFLCPEKTTGQKTLRTLRYSRTDRILNFNIKLVFKCGSYDLHYRRFFRYITTVTELFFVRLNLLSFIALMFVSVRSYRLIHFTSVKNVHCTNRKLLVASLFCRTRSLLRHKLQLFFN